MAKTSDSLNAKCALVCLGRCVMQKPPWNFSLGTRCLLVKERPNLEARFSSDVVAASKHYARDQADKEKLNEAAKKVNEKKEVKSHARQPHTRTRSINFMALINLCLGRLGLNSVVSVQLLARELQNDSSFLAVRYLVQIAFDGGDIRGGGGTRTDDR